MWRQWFEQPRHEAEISFTKCTRRKSNNEGQATQDHQTIKTRRRGRGQPLEPPLSSPRNPSPFSGRDTCEAPQERFQSVTRPQQPRIPELSSAACAAGGPVAGRGRAGAACWRRCRRARFSDAPQGPDDGRHAGLSTARGRNSARSRAHLAGRDVGSSGRLSSSAAAPQTVKVEAPAPASPSEARVEREDIRLRQRAGLELSAR